MNMKIHSHFNFSLLIVIFSLVSFNNSYSLPSISPLLGIAPQDEKFFKANIMTCRTVSKNFTKSQLNDDFCDCPDGTDEPGTSACPDGKFYCRNTGHIPAILFSSRVNDGICDCCDGSDEYDGKLRCSNTCSEIGKAAREHLKRKIKMYQRGINVRKRDTDKAKIAVANDESELTKLKSEERVLKRLVDKLKARKEQIEKAEEKKHQEKENEEKAKKEESKKVNNDEKEAEANIDDTKDISLKSSGDDMVSLSQETLLDQRGRDEPENKERLSKEELGRLVASRWTGEKTGNQVEEINTAKGETYGDLIAEMHSDNVGVNHGSSNQHQIEEESAKGENYGDQVSEKNSDNAGDNHGSSDLLSIQEEFAKGEIYDNRISEMNSKNGGDDHISSDQCQIEEESAKGEIYDDRDSKMNSGIVGGHHGASSRHQIEEELNDLSDIASLSRLSWMDKIKAAVQYIFLRLNLVSSTMDKADADSIQKQYDDLCEKLSKLQSRISALSEKLKHDCGVEQEFYLLHDRCFKIKQNKYLYNICPFKEASQEEDRSTTYLGDWEKFENSYKVMLFSNGDHCWNGPDRTLKVELTCGLDNEVTTFSEPSRCEYVAQMSTPALCLEGKLKELEYELKSTSEEQPQSHDEL